MYLKQLTIYNYKNIKECDISLSSNVNCLVGKNGEGKTNVLDAIYFLSFCKSSTNSNDSHVINHDADFFTLVGDYSHDDTQREKIFCSVRRKHKKVFKHNDKEYDKLSSHIGKILLVLISPNDQELILGGSELRRKFMDLVISQYDADYLQLLIRYKQALQQRNSLLKNADGFDSEIMDIYEREMAKSGLEIFKKRKAFTDDFLPVFHRIHSEMSNGNENVHIEYTSHAADGDLLQTIQASRERDRIMGYSLKGIHRDDLELLLNDFPIKNEGSQGQNKTFLISMKLAQFDYLKEKGRRGTPILLLDDIFDKLDEHRVEQIVKMVSGNRFGQIFITDTNRAFTQSVLQKTGKEFKIFNVINGEIHS